MTISEINDKCIAFCFICEEMKVRYRDKLMGRVGESESKRQEVLDEAINCLEFLADTEEVGREKNMTINLDGSAIVNYFKEKGWL